MAQKFKVLKYFSSDPPARDMEASMLKAIHTKDSALLEKEHVILEKENVILEKEKRHS